MEFNFNANSLAILLWLASLLFVGYPLPDTTPTEDAQSRYFLPHTNMSKTCPPWFVPNNNDDCECSKHRFKGIIKCDHDEAKVLDCYCATYDESSHEMVVGSCFYNCENNDQVFHDTVYHKINEYMCEEEFNRSGVLCGKCKNDTFPLMYSFDMSCVQCDSDVLHWVTFFLIVTVPSTLFFIFILLFKINVMSSYLHGFIFYSQGVSIPAIMRLILRGISKQQVIHNTAQSIAAFYGFWNLDFFRTLMPQMCVRLTTLQTISLDYLVALYPLLLTVISYFIVHLYYKKYKVVLFLSHPLQKFFSRFQRTWNIKSSLMNAFVTFFLISFMKFLSTSVDLLIPTYIHSAEGNTYMASYYDASLKFFSQEHLPLALTALLVLIFFVLFPTLLVLLYPFYYFQIILRTLCLNTSFLKLFVSHFHRCYKDGSDPNTRDCRWFASLFLIVRILLVLVYSFTLTSVFFPLAVTVIFIFVMILISVKPYKEMYENNLKFDATFMLLLSLFYLSIISLDVSSVKDHRLVKISFYTTAISGIVPFIYVTTIIFFWIISKRNYGPLLIKKVMDNWKSRSQIFEEDNGDVPDRLENPSDYDSKVGSMNVSRSEMSSVGITY